jgi:glycerol uptake facilitator-like aquaporin
VLILVFGPVSGANFNPAVSLALALRGELSGAAAGLYVISQMLGATLGVLLAHLMFELHLWQLSSNVRTGIG